MHSADLLIGPYYDKFTVTYGYGETTARRDLQQFISRDAVCNVQCTVNRQTTYPRR